MKRIFLAIILISFAGHGQGIGLWTAFYDKDSTLMGFKDAHGEIVIAPRFSPMTSTRYVAHLAGVTEKVSGTWRSYYLLRSGKTIGRDSVYIFDNGPDCENEGFIRFRDPVTGKAGLFDKYGHIAIPAQYSDISRVNNGLVWALKDAVAERTVDGEHQVWIGGKTLLLDTTHTTLVDPIDYSGTLDLFSLRMSARDDAQGPEVGFNGTNGQWYIFKDVKKDFETWLRDSLLPELSQEGLEEVTMDSLPQWEDGHPIWVPRSSYLEMRYSRIRDGLQAIQTSKAESFISVQGLDAYLYDSPEYTQFFNTCGEARREQYPVLVLVINRLLDPKQPQEQFRFLKMGSTYRFLGYATSGRSGY